MDNQDAPTKKPKRSLGWIGLLGAALAGAGVTYMAMRRQEPQFVVHNAPALPAGPPEPDPAVLRRAMTDALFGPRQVQEE